MVVGPDFVYLAIPRTASTTMRDHVLPIYGGRHVPPHHQRSVPGQYRSYFKFTVVRNPYDRMMSAWAHLTNTRDKWILDKTPTQFVRACGEWKLGMNQSEFLGQQELDMILRFENLIQELERLPFVRRTHVKDGHVLPLPHLNAAPRSATVNLDEFIEAVNEHSAPDFERFGYRCEDPAVVASGGQEQLAT